MIAAWSDVLDFAARNAHPVYRRDLKGGVNNEWAQRFPRWHPKRFCSDCNGITPWQYERRTGPEAQCLWCRRPKRSAQQNEARRAKAARRREEREQEWLSGQRVIVRERLARRAFWPLPPSRSLYDAAQEAER